MAYYRKYNRKKKKRTSEEARIRQHILDRIPDSYADLYPAAREMKRHFIIHTGGTNSGKTYESLQALKEAKKGYLPGAAPSAGF